MDRAGNGYPRVVWWGRRRRRRRVERGLDDDLSRVRRQMAQDAVQLTARWRELDRLDAELARKRAELRQLQQRLEEGDPHHG